MPDGFHERCLRRRLQAASLNDVLYLRAEKYPGCAVEMPNDANKILTHRQEIGDNHDLVSPFTGITVDVVGEGFVGIVG